MISRAVVVMVGAVVGVCIAAPSPTPALLQGQWYGDFTNATDGCSCTGVFDFSSEDATALSYIVVCDGGSASPCNKESAGYAGSADTRYFWSGWSLLSNQTVVANLTQVQTKGTNTAANFQTSAAAMRSAPPYTTVELWTMAGPRPPQPGKGVLLTLRRIGSHTDARLNGIWEGSVTLPHAPSSQKTSVRTILDGGAFSTLTEDVSSGSTAYATGIILPNDNQTLINVAAAGAVPTGAQQRCRFSIGSLDSLTTWCYAPEHGPAYPPAGGDADTIVTHLQRLS